MQIFLASCLLSILIHTGIITGTPLPNTGVGSAALQRTATPNPLTAIPPGISVIPTTTQLSKDSTVVQLQYTTSTGLSNEISVTAKLATILVSATVSYAADAFPEDKNVPLTIGLFFCDNQEEPENGWVCFYRDQAPTMSEARKTYSWYGPAPSVTTNKKNNRKPVKQVGKRDLAVSNAPTKPVVEVQNVEPRSLEERARVKPQVIIKAVESFKATGWPKEGTTTADNFDQCENLVVPKGNIVPGGKKQSCWTYTEYTAAHGSKTRSWYGELAPNTATPFRNAAPATYGYNKLGWMFLITAAAFAGVATA